MLLVCGLVVGCEKKDAGSSPTPATSSATPAISASAPPSSSASAKSKPPPSGDKKIAPSKGAATLPEGFTAKSTRKGGAAIAYKFALAYRYEGSKILHLELSTHQRGCTDVGADERELGTGESIIDLAVAPQIGKNPPSFAVVELAEQTDSGTTSFAVGPRADVKVLAGDPMHDVKLVVSNGVALTDDEPLIDGTIVAWGCHVVPSLWDVSDPKPKPQPGLTLDIDGQKLVVQGAVHHVSRKQIVLSTRGLSCTGTAAETEVLVTLSDGGDEANVSGYSIKGAERPETQKTPLKVTLQEYSFGRSTDDVKLAGTFTVAGHRGSVQGSATLLSCP
jgi:hypothetical protein